MPEQQWIKFEQKKFLEKESKENVPLEKHRLWKDSKKLIKKTKTNNNNNNKIK